MAGLFGTLWWRGINTFHHASNYKTIVAVKPATNTPFKVLGFHFSMRGITAANPHCSVGLALLSGSPTAGGTGAVDQAATYNDANNLVGVRRRDPSRSEAMQFTYSVGPSTDAAWTADYTLDTTRDTWLVGPRLVHEQGAWPFQNFTPYPILIPGGTVAGIIVNNPNAAGVICEGWLDFEE